MSKLLIRICIIMLATATMCSGQKLKECKDTESWCPTSARFCEDSETMLEKCPETCGACRQGCEQCQQKCKVHADNTTTCSCVNGYKLASDNATCEDINECISNPCTEEAPFCENLDGGFSCTRGQCPTRFKDFTNSLTREGCCRMTNGTCGKNLQNKINRVIKGKSAIPRLWPWMVHIPIGGFICGGSLINEQWVVSAAHCFLLVDPKRQKVHLRLGVNDIQDAKATYIRIRTAVQIILHPDYNGRNNDISLIKMNQPVVYSDFISPICLPNGHVPTTGTKCYATGFGLTDPSGSASSVLQEVDLPIVDMDDCTKAYEGIEEIDNKTMLCAGYIEGGKDTCTGDSGGPLVCQRCDSCDWYLTGVTSFGKGCAEAGVFGVYVNVEHFENWIAENAEDITIEKETCMPTQWSEWSSWSVCSTTCGLGEQQRSRSCLNGAANFPGCLGDEHEIRNCSANACVDKWSQWSECSATCGGGSRTRELECSTEGCRHKTQTETCNRHDCHRFSKWSEWSPCDVTCGTGSKTRSRKCEEVSARKNGCKGLKRQTRSCDAGTCPTWSEWGQWTECPVTCGGGIQARERKCVGGKPETDCPGSSTRSRYCNTHDCSEPCSEYCLIAAQYGYCIDNSWWMENFCEASCCDDVTSPCYDTYYNCEHDPLLDCRNEMFQSICKQTCGMCF